MLKLILTLGMVGDYATLRRWTVRCRFFLPLYKLYEAWHAAFLPLTNDVAEDVFFPHSPKGVFLSTGCRIGRRCVIMQHVTVGSNYPLVAGSSGGSENRGGKYGAPVIGDDVFIGAGAKIIGPVKIGSGARIGAGCVVVGDVPAGATVVMNKPRIIIHEENEHS